jgi:hypothetical protein
VTWKSKIKAQFPNPNDYSAFMGDFSTATGAVTFTMMILSRYIFLYFGWGVAALITPTVLLITGIAFFSLVLFRCGVSARGGGACVSTWWGMGGDVGLSASPCLRAAPPVGRRQPRRAPASPPRARHAKHSPRLAAPHARPRVRLPRPRPLAATRSPPRSRHWA